MENQNQISLWDGRRHTCHTKHGTLLSYSDKDERKINIVILLWGILYFQDLGNGNSHEPQDKIGNDTSSGIHNKWKGQNAKLSFTKFHIRGGANPGSVVYLCFLQGFHFHQRGTTCGAEQILSRVIGFGSQICSDPIWPTSASFIKHRFKISLFIGTLFSNWVSSEKELQIQI